MFSSLDVCLLHAQALKASLQHPDNAQDPQLRREYLKLFTIASKVAEVRFTCALHTFAMPLASMLDYMMQSFNSSGLVTPCFLQMSCMPSFVKHLPSLDHIRLFRLTYTLSLKALNAPPSLFIVRTDA